jgi:hypothetical protein
VGGSMSSVVISGDTSGAITLAAPAVSGTNTITLPAATGTAVVAGQNSAITASATQASTSGTAINFTGIPSWVQKVTVNFYNVSTNGNSQVLIRLGTSSGVETTSYQASTMYVSSAVGSGVGFNTFFASATNSRQGSIVFTLVGSNVWVGVGMIGDGGNVITMAGTKALAATLDRVQITTVNGTDLFDAGSINIQYQ